MMRIYLYPIILYALLFGFCGRYAYDEVNNSSQQKFVRGDNKDIINIGLIVDMASLIGKAVPGCIEMAIADFYNDNSHYKTRIALHIRNSEGDSLRSIAAAIDLLETVDVHAMIVPIITNQESVIVRLADAANVPLLSFSSVSLFDEHSYLLQVAGDEISQLHGIASLNELFNWKSCVVLYEDTADARQFQPSLHNILQEHHIGVIYHTAISVRATNEEIVDELHKLMKMRTPIIIVHMSPSLASQIFLNAKVFGMMSKGYAWIVTSETMNFLDFQDSSIYESMQGVLGFRSYMSPLNKLLNFTSRWKKEFHRTESNTEFRDLNVYCLWAYDAVWALAQAIEKAGIKPSPRRLQCKLLNLSCIHVSTSGVVLLQEISRTKFRGLAGDFELVNRKLVHETYEIVNVIGKGERRVGFWTSADGLTKESYPSNKSSSENTLDNIIWPGISLTTPVSRLLQISGKSLRVGIPAANLRPELVNWNYEQNTKVVIADGFCVEVFRAAFEWLKYNISIDFYPFYNGTYNDLVYQVYLQKYDAAVGDITILSTRSQYVDFTLPFTDLGVGTVAKLDDKDPWFFLQPLDPDLWMLSACMFVVTGTVVWLIEHPSNDDFQGSPAEQVGKLLWFAVSTLVFAHREKLQKNLSRFVVGVWLFVVLILTSSYTANLSSLLRVQRFKMTKGDYIGSFSSLQEGLVSNLNFGDNRLRRFQYIDDYDEALRKGSKYGGISAIMDEIPYIKIFLDRYPNDYTLIDTSPITNGFGFPFQKGSPLVQEISRAISGLREEGRLLEMEKKWFTRRTTMSSLETQRPTVNTLSIHNFSGRFLLSGISKAIAVLVLLIFLLRERLVNMYIWFRSFVLGRLVFMLGYISPRMAARIG